LNELETLLAKSLECVRRDINHLTIESSTKKLKAPSARDLVAYVKLLSETIKSQEKETDQLTRLLNKLSPDERTTLAKSLLNDRSVQSNSERKEG
jgi:hypothetical protein